MSKVNSSCIRSGTNISLFHVQKGVQEIKTSEMHFKFNAGKLAFGSSIYAMNYIQPTVFPLTHLYHRTNLSLTTVQHTIFSFLSCDVLCIVAVNWAPAATPRTT